MRWIRHCQHSKGHGPAWMTYGLMTGGLVLAALPLLGNAATVMFTFYLPLQAHWAFILCSARSSRSACRGPSHLSTGFPHRHETRRLPTLPPPLERVMYGMSALQSA